MIIGSEKLYCTHGKDFNKSHKEKRKQQRIEEVRYILNFGFHLNWLFFYCKDHGYEEYIQVVADDDSDDGSGDGLNDNDDNKFSLYFL